MATIHAFGPFRLDADAETLFRDSEPLPAGNCCTAVEDEGMPTAVQPPWRNRLDNTETI
jgi:hypothetical protein